MKPECDKNIQSASQIEQLERRGKTALRLSLNPDLVSSWDGRPYVTIILSQSTVMFVVNLKKVI